MNSFINPFKPSFILFLAFCSSVNSAYGQININPLHNDMKRSRVSIDMGDGLRCTSDGGNVPVLSVSMGAYPDQIGNSYEYTTSSNIYQRSGLLALASVHIPLSVTNQDFDCNHLLEDAKVRARLDNLRELADENIISEADYRKAVLKLYDPILPYITEQKAEYKPAELVINDKYIKPQAPKDTVSTQNKQPKFNLASIPPLPPIPLLPSEPKPHLALQDSFSITSNKFD